MTDQNPPEAMSLNKPFLSQTVLLGVLSQQHCEQCVCPLGAVSLGPGWREWLLPGVLYISGKGGLVTSDCV